MTDKINPDRTKSLEELFQENGLPSPTKGFKKLLSGYQGAYFLYYHLISLIKEKRAHLDYKAILFTS